jgi:hypothetical protein
MALVATKPGLHFPILKAQSDHGACAAKDSVLGKNLKTRKELTECASKPNKLKHMQGLTSTSL